MNRQKRRQRRGGPQRLTFNQIRAAEHQRMNAELFRKACDANVLAKMLVGRRQQRAYAIKNACLRQLIERGGVVVGVDHVRCPGLLSVGLNRRMRLHTHENWMYPTSTWRSASK